MKGKSRQGGRLGDATMMMAGLEDVADGPKNAKITLSFPLSAALPVTALTPRSPAASPSSHRRRPSSSSRGSDEGSLWKLDATTDVKHRPFKPPRHDSSPSSSSSSSSSPSSSLSPMDLTASLRKDIKSPPPLKCSKVGGATDSPFHRFPLPPRSSSSDGVGYPGDGREERHRLANGTSTPPDTAKLLFNLSAVAYQGERKERGAGSKGKRTGEAGGAAPHGLGLHPPPLHLPPPLPPSSPSEALNPPPLPSSLSSPVGAAPKSELICGVCHRLFSSASSLTVHMRLHRGGRALSCRHCGKAFIHNKRLLSHEAACRKPLAQTTAGLAAGHSPNPPALPIRPKEEPLEEGEVRIEGGVVVGADGVESSGKSGKKARDLLAAGAHVDAESGELVGGEDNHHFVKVVDGHVIYFCSVCERSYMTLSSLKRHSNVHSWRRKYPCHFCDKVFALAEYRTKHEVWHTGERRYQCIFCWDAFATYYNLKTHQKAIHGISPGLISSEKTANGGYKQKVNALKLYRLLPMRSQKRPYKTYSDGLPDELLPLLTPGDPASSSLPLPPLPVPLDCALANPLASLSGEVTVKPDPDDFPDGFPVSVEPEQGRVSAMAALAQTDGRMNEKETSEMERGMGGGGSNKMSAGGHKSKSKNAKGSRGMEVGVSSVITYGHPKPSVIVHGKAVSPSVIVHSNQVAKSPRPDAGQTNAKTGARPTRRHHHHGESSERQRKRSRDSSGEGSGSGVRQESELGRPPHKSRKSHSKNDSSSSSSTSAKQSSSLAGSEAKGAGPLCQITVRIGEEAMVKRSISETDLRRDKSPHPPKTKRAEPLPQDTKEARHSYHHHHKHRSHRGISPESEKGGGVGGVEAKKKSPKHPDKVREYYFRQEVRETGESDGDGEDNLWRPYYAYKPKRKTQAPLQKARSWQRKLHHKRSLRLMRRAERLMDHVNKETERQEEEEEEEEEEDDGGKTEAERDEGDTENGGEMEEVKGNTEEEDERETSDSQTVEGERQRESWGASKGKDKEEATELHLKPSEPPLPPKLPVYTSACPAAGIKRRPWSNDNAAECGTCGRWFSSPRKRDKHELSHLLEFVCLHCRAPFPSREKLEDHQKTQHPKASEPQSLAPKAAGGDRGDEADGEAEREPEERESRALAKGTPSPSRLSRRALARHTCPQCHKVCKTSSALTRHVRRHELSSSPEREEPEAEAAAETEVAETEVTQAKATEARAAEAKAVETTINSTSKDPEVSAEQVPLSQSIPVISYSTTDPNAGGGDRPEPEQRNGEPSRVKEEQSTVISFPIPPSEIPDVPESEPAPRVIKPLPPDNLVNPPHPLAPAVPAIKPNRPEFPPSALQGVLVMSGSECLDYRAPKKRSVDARLHRIPSPASLAAGPISASPNMAVPSKPRTNTAASATTSPNAGLGCTKREGVIAEKERQGVGKGVFLHSSGYEEPSSFVQDLRVAPLSRSPSPSEAQDLTMTSILAREWERNRERERERQREMEMEQESLREREREMERNRAQHTRGASSSCHLDQSRDSDSMTLLVPKEEPISPAPSPQRTATQTTSGSPLSSHRRPLKSPRRSPTAMDLLAQVNRQAQSAQQHPLHAARNPPDRLFLPPTGDRDRPSGHALLLPRAPPPPPPPEPEDNPSHHGQMEAAARGGYHVQELPLPLIVPGDGGYRPGKKHEENLMMSYAASPLAFGPLGKMLPSGDLAKLPFYPDPYQLIYGPQLLAYPYNLAALPMALNMMAPGTDKVEQLPFLPALFNYAAASPYMGAVPHPLVANPSLYNSSGSGGTGGKKQRDSSNGKP